MRHTIYPHFAHLVVLAIILTGCAGGSSMGGGSTCTKTKASADIPPGAVHLSWCPASGLVAGYNIYYGTTKGEYPHKIEVADWATTAHTIENLPKGTYYFVVTAYDADGNESEHSEVASKTVK